uniref:Uncharacterized protein n=1 Tax=Tanacetum cinerariifolium TaxID=118510 RepID=A0A6L2NGU1_TANCI|nr:hypothetical protein [Tanacetum cinerariifolium]
MANVPPNEPNVNASAIVPAPVNHDHAPAQPVGLGNGFAPHWIGGNIPNNQNGWIEEDAEEEEQDPEEEEEDPKEDSKEDDDDVMEMDDEAEVIDPYMDDGSNNPPPLSSEDEETPPTSPVIPDADGCDNIEMDRVVRNVMSDLSGLKKLVRNLSGRFDEYEGSKVFEDKRVLKKELVNERNGKEFYQEFGEYMCRMLQKCQKSKDSFPLSLDAVIAAAAIATFDINDDEDDIAPMDSQPYEPCGSHATHNFMKGSPITFRGNEGAVGGHFGNRSRDQENVGRDEGDDDGGILSRAHGQEYALRDGDQNLGRNVIIMANIPPNDPNVDASAIVHTLVNPDHAPTQPVGLGNGFAPHWIGEEEDPKEDPEEDDDDVMEMDDEAEVIDPYMDDGLNNPPPPNSKDEETPPTSPVIPDADGQPILPIALFGQNFHFRESSSTANLLTGNSKIVLTGPMCLNLGTAWKRLGKMEKLMSERIDTKGRMKKKFKERDCHFVGLGCDNIEMDRAVRNVMSDLYGLKKLVKDLSDRFDEYEGSKVFENKKVLEKELVNKRNGEEFYQEFSEYIEPLAKPSARPVLAPYSDDLYVVTRDAANADVVAAAVATSGIDDDDDDTAPMDSQPYEPRGSPRDT